MGREVGELVMWDGKRAFGFIKPECGGADVFLHRSQLPRGALIHIGKRVEYTRLVAGDRPRAMSAELLEG